MQPPRDEPRGGQHDTTPPIRFRRSIRGRMFFLALAAVALPVILVALDIAETYRAGREEAFRDTLALARNPAARIDDHVESTRALLNSVSALLGAAPDDAERNETTLRALHGGLPAHYSSIVVAAPDGSIINNTTLPRDEAREINLADRKYFKQALAQPGMVISEPLSSRVTGQWSVIAAQAIRASDGTVRVVLVGTFLQHFSSLLAAANLPPGSLATVLDQQGMVIGRSVDPEQWVGRNLGKSPHFQRVLATGEFSAETVASDGIRRLAAYTTAQRVRWVVYVGIPSDVALAAARSDLVRLVTLTALALLFSGFLAWRISVGISTLLSQLCDDTRRLASGDLTHRSRVQDTGEVGELAAAFNGMAAEMQRRQAGIEEAERALRESEEEYRSLVQASAQIVWRTDPKGRPIGANEDWLAFTGQPSEYLGSDAWLQAIHPGDFDYHMRAWEHAKQERSAYHTELRVRRYDGEYRIFSNRAVPLVQPDGTVRIWVGTCTDITERRRHQALIDGQKRVLELVATQAALAHTLETLVYAIESVVPDMLGSILVLDEDGVHVRHGAAPNLPPAYWHAIDGEAIGERAGSCGTAMFRREAVIAEDIMTDPLWENYRELALEHGLRACWSHPIFDAQRRVIGSFAMYYRRPCRPTPEDLKVIDVVVHIAAVAIVRAREEAVLRESESRFRQLAENIREVFWLTDPEKRTMLYISPVYEAIWGRPRESLLASPQSWLDAIHADDRSRVLEALHDQIAGSYDERYRIVRPDGTQRWIHDRAFPVHADDGTVYRIAGVADDITQQVRAAEERETLSRRNTFLVEALAEIVYEHDVPAGRIRWEGAIEKILGLTNIDSSEETWLTRIHPADLPGVLAQFEKKDGDDMFQAEYRFQHRDGHYVWIFDRGVISRDETGRILGVTGIMWDISARKSAERRIEQQLLELQRWHAVMLGREDRVREMKREVNELLRAMGRPARYPSEEAGSAEGTDVAA
ncbi:MAG: PAS domain-containing protein [Betaproteobacteria bacterium]